MNAVARAARWVGLELGYHARAYAAMVGLGVVAALLPPLASVSFGEVAAREAFVGVRLLVAFAAALAWGYVATLATAANLVVHEASERRLALVRLALGAGILAAVARAARMPALFLPWTVVALAAAAGFGDAWPPDAGDPVRIVVGMALGGVLAGWAAATLVDAKGPRALQVVAVGTVAMVVSLVVLAPRVAAKVQELAQRHLSGDVGAALVVVGFVAAGAAHLASQRRWAEPRA